MLNIQKSYKNNWPTIYVVSTPIGNLGDMSKRSIEILNSVETIYCEDTRTSKVLLNNFSIKKHLVSLHKFNELSLSDTITNSLNANNNIAIISDAGLPGMSDPGMRLIEHLIWDKQMNVNIVCIGGSTAINHTLIASSQYFYEYIFVGFLDKKETKLVDQLKNAVGNSNERLICFYESIHRIKDTIKIINNHFPESKVTVARELTKINEEIIRGSINEVSEYINSSEFVDKGEVCVVFKTNKHQQAKKLSDKELLVKVNFLVNQGIKSTQAIKEIVAIYDVDRNYLYDLWKNEK
ncbi:16S rRNA (cytidine1402-2'-O)-methyltransferase [Spiroplasma sp. TIUS-1]|uniref:16S rRNA (cytidine(1402)-2'-O)-methyltransferase n=1 Tax=Spiroplasma sp. TIUS-1 TaxID=216963 RepID=UPI0013971FAD|nr:16S rRNA (cytidine(1402)-2'-O)-methyltransferase [Spiroplasma sp. TIUS-1]QHX36041.1 16S rRNA (cytidine1402-2'-O)-methyltransferase [Spiroplasma sp. TIUS-1]